MKDYYYILGVERNADLRVIKGAYRKLSLKFHPDKNPNDLYFESRFKEINEAYGVLSDSTKRTKYDQDFSSFITRHGGQDYLQRLRREYEQELVKLRERAQQLKSDLDRLRLERDQEFLRADALENELQRIRKEREQDAIHTGELKNILNRTRKEREDRILQSIAIQEELDLLKSERLRRKTTIDAEIRRSRLIQTVTIVLIVSVCALIVIGIGRYMQSRDIHKLTRILASLELPITGTVFRNAFGKPDKIEFPDPDDPSPWGQSVYWSVANDDLQIMILLDNYDQDLDYSVESRLVMIEATTAKEVRLVNDLVLTQVSVPEKKIKKRALFVV